MKSNLTKLGQTSTKLSKLERRWYAEYIAIGCVDATQALRNVYLRQKRDGMPSGITQRASAIRKSVFGKVGVDDIALMDAIGLTDERLHKKLLDKIESKRVVIVDGKPFSFEDNPSQIKALELAYSLKNKIKTNLNVEGNLAGGIQVNIQVNNGFATRDGQTSTTPSGSDAEQPTEVQSPSVAQEIKEDNNSDTRTTETSTP